MLQSLIEARKWLVAAAVLVIAIVGGVMTYALATRHNDGVSVLHDRNPLFVKTADGSIRNGYTIRVLNRAAVSRRFAIAIDGIASTHVEIVGIETAADGSHAFDALQMWSPPQIRSVSGLRNH